jgi:hypothetical protein
MGPEVGPDSEEEIFRNKISDIIAVLAETESGGGRFPRGSAELPWKD